MILCPHCGEQAHVFFTKKEEDYIRFRKYRCTKDKRHSFWMVELPEPVFKDQEHRLRHRLQAWIRAQEMKRYWEDVRRRIDVGLDEQKTPEVIASEAGCSASLVRKRAQERELGLGDR